MSGALGVDRLSTDREREASEARITNQVHAQRQYIDERMVAVLEAYKAALEAQRRKSDQQFLSLHIKTIEMQLRSLYIKMADEADDPVLLLEEEALREQLRRARQEMEALRSLGP